MFAHWCKTFSRRPRRWLILSIYLGLFALISSESNQPTMASAGTNLPVTARVENRQPTLMPDAWSTVLAGIAVTVATLICTIRVRRSQRREAELRQSEEQFRLLFEGVKDFAICMLDTTGHVVNWNTGAEAMTGYVAEEAIGRDVTCFYPTEEIEKNSLNNRLRQALLEGRYQEEGWRVRKDGSRFIANVILTALHDETGKLRGYAKVMRDVTERRQESWLEDDRRQVLQIIAEDQPQQAVFESIVRMLERQRPGMCALIALRQESGFGVTAGAGLPETFVRGIDGAGGPIHSPVPLFITDLNAEGRFGQFRNLAAEHSLSSCWSVPIFDYGGKVLGTLALCSTDPSSPEQKDRELLESAARLAAVAIQHCQLKDQLAYQARHDPLTALPNRALFEDRLSLALTTAKRTNRNVGVLFVDLDRFKLVNDTLGHSAGDFLLKEVAGRLKNVLRESDTLCRMGGDEFTIILPDLADNQDAVRVARRLLEVLGKPIAVSGRELFVTTSVGISLFPHDGQDAQELQRSADVAMYKAKAAGGNKFQFFAADMNSEAVERLEIETQLRQALENHELELHYQAKVDRSARLIGLEALIRWRHPEKGLISPVKFIGIAEEAGLIVPIGQWVLKEACRQVRAWQNEGLPALRIAVNVSALQFLRNDFVETIQAALTEHRLEARWLEIELTESLLMHNTDDVAAKLARVRALGVSVAIDDFGTGYSSLSYLQRLPIDTLKIDRAFIREIGSGKSRDNAIIKAIVSLGRSLRMQVIAEGVETDEQFQVLLRVGCEGFQGFLFARPVAAQDVAAMLVPRNKALSA